MYNIDSIFTWIVTRPCAQWQQIGKSKVLGNKNTKGIAYTYKKKIKEKVGKFGLKKKKTM
jgi:hypothetical protein